MTVCYQMPQDFKRNKKLIRRWDSECDIFTTTSYTYYKIQSRHKHGLSQCLL